jgi:hypothetical protein
MGNGPGKTPVPIAGRVDLAPLSGKNVGPDHWRVKTNHDQLKELIIHDDQRESDSVLGLVGNGRLGGSLICARGEVLQQCVSDRLRDFPIG